ncbi:MAG: RDD family protein [Bacillota bacterium]|jgi:uncharacterized RDD family membrane protein YckC
MLDFPKASLGKRVVAAIIDGLIAGCVSLVPVVGGVAGFAYVLLKDGFLDGASPGKKAMGLRVVEVGSGARAAYGESIRRNLIFAIPNLITIIPLIGAIIAPILALLVYLLELYIAWRDPRGRRYGDHIASTQVVPASA